MERTDGCASCGEPCGGAPAYVCEDCGRAYCAACARRAGALCPCCCGRLLRPS